MIFFLIILCALAVAGCATATHATLAVYSQPPGAYLTEVGTGRALGIAPAASYYEAQVLQNHKDVHGCYVVKGVEAHWVSGARAMTDPVRLCGSATGSYNITLSRDASYPDLEKDLQFALQIQAILAQQDAVRRQAAMQLLLNNMNARPIQPYQLPMPPPPRPSVNTNCVQFGNTWNCTTR
jgi:hypothetical protein